MHSRHTRNTMYHMILYYIIIIYKCGTCAVFDELYPGTCITTEGKTRKKPQLGYHNTQYLYKILQSISLSAKQHTLLFTVIKNHNGIHTSLYTVIKITINTNTITQSKSLHVTLVVVFHGGILKAGRSWAAYTHVTGVAEMKVHN